MQCDLSFVKDLPHRLHEFLATNDFPTLLAAIDKFEWGQIVRSIYTWAFALPIFIYLVWTRKFKAIIALVSFALFIVLIQKTLAPAGDTLALNDLLIFVGGVAALVGLNFYMIFVRQ